MNTKVQKILEVNLTKKIAETKSFDHLQEYIGGVGLGLKLMEIYRSRKPVILATGPLSGFFPYASKTAVIVDNDGIVEDLYIGGSLSMRMTYAGINAIVIYGTAAETAILNIIDDTVTFEKSPTETNVLGLPGKRCVLEFSGTKILLDKFFQTPEDIFEKFFIRRNLAGLVVTGTKTFSPHNFDEYSKLYKTILDKQDTLPITPYDNPSCANCPLGCVKSEVGEIGGNVLIHSLVACEFAEKLYSDIGLVFSCMNVLGYDYTHEDLENLPGLIEITMQSLAKDNK